MKSTDLRRRAEAIIAGVTGDFALDETLELPLLRGERVAGRVLTRLVVTAALLTVLAAVTGAALAWPGIWAPLVASLALVILAAISWRVSALVPTRALPVWTALALLLISLGATSWAGLTHDEQLLPRGEAGVNAQAAVSLARGHQWPIALSANELGGPEVLRIPGLTIQSPGFGQVGTAAEPVIEPGVLIGVPLWLSFGFWAGGVAGMLWVPALFGGLVVLAVGLLTSSVVGPRWGPLGALATAACYPVLHAARATSADVVVLFVVSMGLLLLVAATRAGSGGRAQQAQAVGFMAGALVASGSFFRPDAVGQTILLLPVAALLMIRRHSAGAPALWGAGAATALSALVGLGLSGSTPLRGLAMLALPSPQALAWTSWWTGPYALVLTLVIVAVGAHNLTRSWFRGGQLPAWFGALAVGLGAGLIHWRSPSWGKTAPWIHEGLVMAVPLVVVCVALATAWVTRWSTRHLPTVAAVVVSVGTAATLLVPEVAATLPHSTERVSLGQVAAVQQVCRALAPADVVLMVDGRAADEWLPTVRATCGAPALSLTVAARRDRAGRASAVAALAPPVEARGGRLVVMAAGSVAALVDSASANTRIGVPFAVVSTSVTQDAANVAGRPDGLSSFPVQVWLATVR